MSAKQFLMTVGAVSFAIWLGANVLLGPPGLSNAYLRDVVDETTGEVLQAGRKADHDRYLSITKSAVYKLHVQRPALHAGSVPQEDLDFVAAYASDPSFLAEQRRIRLYDTFFDFFNMALVLVLVVHFGRKPVLKLLDEKISELRERVESAAAAREEALARKSEAQGKIAGLSEEEKEVEAETRKRLDKELGELEKANEHSLSVMEKELADRKRGEEHAAALLVKREMVNAVIDLVAEGCRTQQSEAEQARLLEGFIGDVEKLA